MKNKEQFGKVKKITPVAHKSSPKYETGHETAMKPRDMLFFSKEQYIKLKRSNEH